MIKPLHLVTCPGFNDKSGGADNVKKLWPYLPYHHQDGGYGYFNRFSVRFYNDNIAQVIAGMTLDDSVGLGYSNGCDILIKACERGAKFRHLVLFNPALNSDFKVPFQVERVDVFHNEGDRATALAKWIPFSSWGDAGNVGYTGKDKRVFNHDEKALYGALGHGASFNLPRQVGEDVRDLIDAETERALAAHRKRI